MDDWSALPYCPPSASDTESVDACATNSNGILSSDEEPMPLPLQVDIPKAHLPDVIEVFIGERDVFCGALPYERVTEAQRHNWQKLLAHGPLKFVRTKPRGHITIRSECEGLVEASTTLGCNTVGQLDLREPKFLDRGNHSYVFLAPLTLPSSAATPALRSGVVVKMVKASRSRKEDCDMLKNEAEVYDSFPGALQGCDPSAPPIVPKFYGCYSLSLESIDLYKDEDEEIRRTLVNDTLKFFLCLTPMLLLEYCGEPIGSESLSTSNWDTITGMYERLHDAGFVQKSVYARNVLVQPGPLTHPRAERSLDNPSFRLIDFGRGKCFSKDEPKSANADLKLESELVRYLRRDYF